MGKGRSSAAKSIDLGGGYTTSKSVLNLRTKVNAEIGASTKSADLKYGIRVDKAAGKSDKQIMAEDTKRLKNAQARKKKNKKVNSYGEATTRNITSGTYKRAQKRTQKAVNDWFGRGMG